MAMGIENILAAMLVGFVLGFCMGYTCGSDGIYNYLSKIIDKEKKQ